MARTINKQRISTAYHEAGHAVVAYLLGYKPRLVTIRAFRNTAGRVEHRAVRGTKRPAIEANIMISLAGPLAERIEMGTAVHQGGWIDDIMVAADEVDALKMFPELAGDLMADLSNRTTEMLTDNWPKVDMTAKMLLEFRRLNRRQMITIMSFKREVV